MTASLSVAGIFVLALCRRFRRKMLLCALLLCLPATVSAADLAPGIRQGKAGVITAAGVRIELMHYATGWKGTSQGSNLQEEKQEVNGNITTLRGVLASAGGALQFSLQTTPVRSAQSGTGCGLSYRLTSEAPVGTQTAAVVFKLPVETFAGGVLNVDGTSVPLPLEYKNLLLPTPATARQVSIPTEQGVLTIRGAELRLTLQDDRQFKSDTFSLRLIMKGADAALTDASLPFELFVLPYRVTPLDLLGAANLSRRDENADDRQGGWTDQGDNDLRSLPAGRTKFGGVEFLLPDPAANQGKTCLVFAGGQRDYFLKEAKIPVPSAAKNDHYLYLLHATAWTPAKGETVGTVIAEYEDGSKSEHPLLARIDVGDWWKAERLERAAVGWKGENPHSEVGLYVTMQKLENKPLAALRLVSGGKAVWMVPALSLSDSPIPAPRELPCTITAGKDWLAFEPEQSVIPGSIMDFSALNDAPAGKYGPLVVRDGHFECEQKPGQRVRLVGANLCFSANYLEKSEADKLARQWQLMGYNSVRLHHYDRILVGGWEAKRSDQIDPAALDKLDYTFAAMKKAGMYATIDLYTIRTFAAGEIAGWDKPAFREIKPLLPILPDAFEAWSRMVLQLMNHVNPYTGLAWKDDPAFFSLCPVNEDGIFAVWAEYPEVKALYLQHFEEWLRQKALTPATASERDSLLARFLIEVKTASNRQLADFFRKNGVRALITGSNFISRQAQTFMREGFDFVDNHQYWDHPRFPATAWQLPYGFQQRSVIRALAETPRGMMASRVFGKPFTVTEFNYTPPNQYRAEGGAVMGAYAALQDWDGLYRFAWSHSDKNIITRQPLSGFDAATDPISLMTERQILLLFQRGDASPAGQRYVYAVTMPEATQTGTGGGGGFPDAFSKLGLLQQIGSQAVDGARGIRGTFAGVTAAADPGEKARAGNPFVPASALPVVSADQPILSATGEIELSPQNGLFKVTTPRTACLVLPQGMTAAAGCLRVSDGDSFCSVSASAMDGQPLAQSRRILVLHLTNILNSGMRFRSASMTTLEDWGKLPLLVRRGTAKIALQTSQAGLKVWAIAPSGRRLAQVPAVLQDGRLVFTAQPVPEPLTPVLAYEISAE